MSPQNERVIMIRRSIRTWCLQFNVTALQDLLSYISQARR